MSNLKLKKWVSLTFLFLLASLMQVSAQTFQYQKIAGWSDATNAKLKAFLESTVPMNTRKVAVFDCDGTLFGQCPHYLADEALYDYAKRMYAGKNDKKSKEKMKIVDQLLHGDNVGVEYVQNRIKFLSGMTTEEIQRLGDDMFHQKYQNKFYPQMKALLANLKNYDFELWIVSASPELLYQRFCEQQLGFMPDRILGVRSLVTVDGVTTDKMVFPVPQDEGKAEVINTFIKARPLFAAGNSRGDMEMMNTSVGLKLMLNPDNKKAEKVMGGKTAKAYWEADPNCIIEYVRDVPEGNHKYVCDEDGVKTNAATDITDAAVVVY